MKYEVRDRTYVPCLYNCSELRVLSMLFDTGAMRTVVCTDSLNGVEIRPTGRYQKFRTATRDSIVLSEIIVPQFTVGNIDMRDCRIWTGDNIIDLLGLDLLSKINWKYLPDERMLEITGPVYDDTTTTAVKYVREFCLKHNLSTDILTSTFPDNWDQLDKSIIEELVLFTCNNLK